MNCIAHRGFAAVAPENTLRAVVEAETIGAPVVEVDVRRCGSGDLVLVHDETVDRVTGASGRVDDLGVRDLASLDVLGSGEGVPALSEVFTAVSSAAILLDLKERGLVHDALSLADDHEVDVLVSAFDSEVVRSAVEAGAPWVALLAAEDLGPARRRAVDLGCDGIHPRLAATTAEFVAAAHDVGLAVNPWTARSREEGRAAARMDPDGVISDAPAYCGVDGPTS